MTHRLLGIALSALVALFLFPAGVQAAVCASHETLTAGFHARFGEVPIGEGKVGENTMHLLVSPDGSWTVILARKDGVSCVVSSGDKFKTVVPETPETKS